nr:MAG TPA: hypothetical protein [Caudoviricetes sp.]
MKKPLHCYGGVGVSFILFVYFRHPSCILLHPLPIV